MAEPISSTGNTNGHPVGLGAGLCAILPLLGGIVFYFIEKKDAFVRHWAVQSICFGATWFGFHLAVTVLISVAGASPGTPYVVIPLLLLLDSAVLLIFFTLWIIGIIKVLQGERWEYPLISAPCRRLFPTGDGD
jgi:uncharacterized membrane protein